MSTFSFAAVGLYTVKETHLDKVVNFEPDAIQRHKVVEAANSNKSVIRLNIATDSSKYDWMRAAKDKFEKENRNTVAVNGVRKTIQIILHSMGSIDSAKALQKDSFSFQVWAPASSLYRDFVKDYYEGELFLTDTPLVRTPMVFAIYDDARNGIESLINQEKLMRDSLSFNMVAEVFDKELMGAFSVNNKAENYGPWRIESGNNFKFGFARPESSNGGATALIAMAYEYFSGNNMLGEKALDSERGFKYIGGKITQKNLKDKGFQQYLAFIKGQSNQDYTSTGKLADEFGSVHNLDAVWIYENEAIRQMNDQLTRMEYSRQTLSVSRKAESLRTKDHLPEFRYNIIDNIYSRVKWSSSISVKYPKYNIWNDNPYYTLKHRSSLEQQDAARVFLDYLLEKDQQLMALSPKYGGFRPTSPEVSQYEISKVFSEFRDRGISFTPREESRFVETQSGDVLRGLFYIFNEVDGIN